jgi:hypothetical protein
MTPSHHPCPSPETETDQLSEAVRILRFALKRRRRGKIAALPEPVREQINVMLEDGVSYTEIIRRLGEDGKGLTEHCLSRWFKSCFKDWREARLQAEVFGDPKRQPSQAIADLQTILFEFDPVVLAPLMKRDPSKFIPLATALARIAVALSQPGSPEASEDGAKQETTSACLPKNWQGCVPPRPNISPDFTHAVERVLVNSSSV